jgi:DNA-binding Lrp family transcriptional regulator
MDELDKLLLTVVNKNARVELEDLAMMLDTNVDEVKKRLSKLEKDKVICGYQTVTNWDRTDLSQVTALIEVSVIPERKYGYNRIASKIYRFEEVD